MDPNPKFASCISLYKKSPEFAGDFFYKLYMLYVYHFIYSFRKRSYIRQTMTEKT